MLKNNLLILLWFLTPIKSQSFSLSYPHVNYLTVHNERTKRGLMAVDIQRINKTISDLIEIWTVKKIPPTFQCYPEAEENAHLETRGNYLNKLKDPATVTEADIKEAEEFITLHINGLRCNDKIAYCSTTQKVCVCRAFRFNPTKYKPAEPNGDDCVLSQDHPCDYSFDFKCQTKQRCMISQDDVLCSKANNDHRDEKCGGTTPAEEVDCKCMDVNRKRFSTSYNETNPPRTPDCTGYGNTTSSGMRPHRIDMRVEIGISTFFVFFFRFYYDLFKQNI